MAQVVDAAQASGHDGSNPGAASGDADAADGGARKRGRADSRAGTHVSRLHAAEPRPPGAVPLEDSEPESLDGVGHMVPPPKRKRPDLSDNDSAGAGTSFSDVFGGEASFARLRAASARAQSVDMSAASDSPRGALASAGVAASGANATGAGGVVETPTDAQVGSPPGRRMVRPVVARSGGFVTSASGGAQRAGDEETGTPIADRARHTSATPARIDDAIVLAGLFAS
ncbi:hypothetical protein EON62_00260 [archaeon]|nr:MAG: hypothetical protein EON62_00260 [archaeon]